MIPRRIAYILNIFPKVSETFIATELVELLRRGVEVRILSMLPPRNEVRHDIIQNAALDRITSYDPFSFAETLAAFKPDLLHAHFAKEATAKARQIAVEQDLPFTFTAHGYDIYRKPPPDFHDRAMAAGAVVTVSEANASYIARTFQVPRERIEVIPCGIDTDRFRPGSEQSTTQDHSSRPPLVLCVARQVAVKNLLLLLQACALLRDEGIGFRCVILGDGPMRGELEAENHRLGLNGIVEMPGAADQATVADYWQRAAVGVLTSHNEGMPVSLMEAAASGVPVVATHVGGIPELVENGATGLLVPAGDVSAFAAAVRALLADEALRQRMGLAARARAKERYSIQRQVHALLDLWARVLDARMQSFGNARSCAKGAAWA